MTDEPNPWHSRGYLPHFDVPGTIQFVTFRLHDSLPREVLEGWRRDLRWHEEIEPDHPSVVEIHRRIARYEDQGHGSCWLAQPEIARLVENALLHFDGARYRLLAWCVMPNHVHTLLETLEEYALSEVLHSWKSFTAKRANTLLGRSGRFWQEEYYDRYVRNAEHLARVITYIEGNPVRAGLAEKATNWKWSSAGRRLRRESDWGW